MSLIAIPTGVKQPDGPETEFIDDRAPKAGFERAIEYVERELNYKFAGKRQLHSKGTPGICGPGYSLSLYFYDKDNELHCLPLGWPEGYPKTQDDCIAHWKKRDSILFAW